MPVLFDMVHHLCRFAKGLALLEPICKNPLFVLLLELITLEQEPLVHLGLSDQFIDLKLDVLLHLGFRFQSDASFVLSLP